MLATLLAILSTAAASADAAPSTARYAIEVSVVSEGVETVAARTLIREEGMTEISISDGMETFTLNAELVVLNEIGPDSDLDLVIAIADGDHPPANPRLTFKRGARAAMEMRSDGYGVKLNISPVAP
jgi:hypothetical protein